MQLLIDGEWRVAAVGADGRRAVLSDPTEFVAYAGRDALLISGVLLA